MATNPNNGFGFRFIKMLDGTVPNYGVRQGLLQGGASGFSTAIYSGDVLAPASGGYLTLGTISTNGATIGGIAESFEWVSIAQNKLVRQLYWPGTPSDVSGGGNVKVNYYSNPGCIFEAQCVTGPITAVNIGMYANFNLGSGGHTTGAGNYSGELLDDSTLTTSSAMPFKIYNIPGTDPTTSALFVTSGYDPTNSYNRVWVTMSNLTPE